MRPISLFKNVLFHDPDGPAIIKAKYRFMSMLKGEGCPPTVDLENVFNHARSPLLESFQSVLPYDCVLPLQLF